VPFTYAHCHSPVLYYHPKHTLKTLTATLHCISISGGFGPSGSTQPMIASVWCCRSGANRYLYRFTSFSVSPRNASCLMNGKRTVYPTNRHIDTRLWLVHLLKAEVSGPDLRILGLASLCPELALYTQQWNLPRKCNARCCNTEKMTKR